MTMDPSLYSQLRRLDHRLQLVVLAIPFVLLGAAGYGFWLGPPARELLAQRGSRALLEETLTGGEAITGELARIRGAVEGLEQQIYGKGMNRPMNQLEAEIIERLQEVSSREHVQLVGIRPKPKRRLRGFLESPIQVEITGTYRDIGRWLWALSAELGFVVVTEYDLRPVRLQDDSPLMMKLTLVSYRSMDP